jgi:creatinine amidohydrolase
VTEVRVERLRPAEVEARMSQAPVAWVPWGAIEYHADHLPFGTDGFTAQAVVERAARLTGGVVLPWSWLTMGTLHLPWSLRYPAALVEAALRATVEQAAYHGARVVVVHTGHAPLDLIHLVKRVCAEVEAAADPALGFRAYGLCYLELNAALGTGLGTDWPVAVDHGATMETSWVLAIESDLVDLTRLPDDPAAAIVGVYGPNPRNRASGDVGAGQIEACARLLAERVGRLLAGDRIDPYADLRQFVARYWPEPLEVTGGRDRDGSLRLTLHNPGPVSRYLTSMGLRVDGRMVDHAGLMLVNATPGESGVAVAGDSLGPECGCYIRRGQTAEVTTTVTAPNRSAAVELELGLAGVTSTRVSARLEAG